MRKHGAETINGEEIHVAGTGAWKTLTVTCVETGNIKVEKKFYKQDFGEIMYSAEYGGYIDALLKSALVKEFDPQEMNIDTESYEEVRSIAMGLEEELIISGD